jgi:hypothetical protein
MRGATIALLGLCLLVFGCSGPPVDLKTGLEIDVVSSGWFDAGIVDGKNKLVPTVSFTVKNVSDQKLIGLQMMATYFRIDKPESEWSNGLLKISGGEGLAPGATTPVLTMKAPVGYTSEDPRADMLTNSYFVDAMVKLIAKYGSIQWTHVKEAPIERQLLTQ